MSETPSKLGRRVDAHHHVWHGTERWDTPLAKTELGRTAFTIHDLIPALRAADIDGSVVVQAAPQFDETCRLLELADQTAEIWGVVGWVGLDASDVADQIEALRARPDGHWLVGIRHPAQRESDPGWLARPRVLSGLHAVAAADLTYDLLVTSVQLPAAIEAAQRVPDLRFILDHGGMPEVAASRRQPWARHIRDLAGCPNVASKLSGLLTAAGPGWSVLQLQFYADHLVEYFGPERVMFGSDWPVSTPRADYAEVVEVTEDLVAELSSADRAQVFGSTACRWYRLDERGT